MFIQVSAIKALPAFMLQKVIDSRRDDWMVAGQSRTGALPIS
jgi:hypothetical protein